MSESKTISPKLLKGEVRWYNRVREFGFIKHGGYNSIHFHLDKGAAWVLVNGIYTLDDFHRTNASRHPREGESVYFIMAYGDKDPLAVPWGLEADLQLPIVERQLGITRKRHPRDRSNY